jgi:hypothetical protein
MSLWPRIISLPWSIFDGPLCVSSSVVDFHGCFCLAFGRVSKLWRGLLFSFCSIRPIFVCSALLLFCWFWFYFYLFRLFLFHVCSVRFVCFCSIPVLFPLFPTRSCFRFCGPFVCLFLVFLFLCVSVYVLDLRMGWI